MENKYSLRMLAMKENHHLSGAERIVREDEIETYVQQMIERALFHSRGKADFISLKVEVLNGTIRTIPPIRHIKTYQNQRLETAVDVLWKYLQPMAFTYDIVLSLYELLVEESHRSGALLVDWPSGEIIPLTNKTSGIRVSRFDWEENTKQSFIKRHPECRSERSLEAIALATKVQYAGVLAEICCSDDPDYTTGYLALNDTYLRIPHIKPANHPFGGRIFIINRTQTNINKLIQFLENEPVLVGEV